MAKHIQTVLKSFFTFIILIACAQTSSFGQSITITATNDLDLGRLNETIKLTRTDLTALGGVPLNKIHVKDAAGRELLVQPLYSEGSILFQADFGPNETRTFHLYAGETHLYKADVHKTYGRIVKERLDDFAWENDRIGQRVYGPALMTTKSGSLTSSAIDIWPKKTSRLIINEWYMTDNYHIDKGDGADLYTSGKSRGVGGDGIWSNDRLWVSENYSEAKIRTTGPLMVSFDLTYNGFDANGIKIKEEKNISLSAGQNLNHFTIKYATEQNSKLQAAAGVQISDLPIEEIRKGLNQYKNNVSIERKPGPVIEKETNPEFGWTALRQQVSVGELYSAIIVNPKNFVRTTQDKDNFLVLTNLPDDNTFSYWAGYSWSESGQFKNFDEWKNYIDGFARGVLSPIKVSVKN